MRIKKNTFTMDSLNAEQGIAAQQNRLKKQRWK